MAQALKNWLEIANDMLRPLIVQLHGKAAV
jgi:hypothetical protein